MLVRMRPDVGPTACLSFEPDEARRLLWLPLAVRHKLDGCGLRPSLLEWQALPLRRAVVATLFAGAGLRAVAILGAGRQSAHRAQANMPGVLRGRPGAGLRCRGWCLARRW